MSDTDQSMVKAKDFWQSNSKVILGVGAALVLLVGGIWGYKHFVSGPKETEAGNQMFKAESYYSKDSVALALNGDGQNLGFLKIIDKYGSTKAGTLAKFYAGSCYLKLNDNTNAIKYLSDFSTESKLVQQRAYKLLGDAYADGGKPKDALSSYKKAAAHFEENQAESAEALFLAGYLADRVLNDQKEAVSLFKQLKEKFPRTQQGFEADKYLAQLGEFNVN